MTDRPVDPTLAGLAVAYELLAERDIHAMSGHEAAEFAVAMGRFRDLADAARLEALVVVQESGVWGLGGSRSAAAWLSRVERSSKAAAGSDLKLARMLAGHLPATAEALRSGDLPVAHARAISRTCPADRGAARDAHRPRPW